MSFRREDAPPPDEVNKWFAELRHESCAQLADRLARGEKPVIVDVRSTGEARTRRIPGSTLVPLQQFEDRMDELLDMPGPLFIHCEHGVRSVDACLLLKWQGRHDVINVSEGLCAWTGPTESG